MLCLDAHVHCGIRDKSTLLTINNYVRHVAGIPISGAAIFPFIMQIYDRWDPNFEDTPEWQQRRHRANEFILTSVTADFEVFPFLFIWNDFSVEDLTEKHCGIKWHRHANEPIYHYDDPRCLQFVEQIRIRKLPVLYEEVLPNTIRFLQEFVPDVPVIIPHMGFLNGGYRALVNHGVFELPNVYVDTSLAPTGKIMDYLNRYGEERVLFGSDFPFGDPPTELEKILRLPISPEKREAIAGLNFQRLMFHSNIHHAIAGFSAGQQKLTHQ